MCPNILEVKNLETFFFTRWGIVKAVNKISFNVKKGEVLGLVGESGSGKSVTAASIMRLVPEPAGWIKGGTIIFNGENLLDKNKREIRKIRGKKISMILQDPMTSLNPVFTIGNQVGESLKTHQQLKGKNMMDRAAELLKSVGIPSPRKRLDNYPHELSGGMKQRVVGAIALSCKPELLIADEPTTSLDTTIQAQYLRLLRHLQTTHGLSMIFITHDFGVVAKICDRVAVMYAGKIVELTDVRELFKKPMHPYTDALIKSVPKVEEKVKYLPSIDGQPPDMTMLDSGCSFFPRCREAMDRCRVEFPPSIMVTENHMVKCWKYK